MTNQFEIDYRKLLLDILDNGINKATRTGHTLTVFNRQLTASLAFDLFPLITGRKMYWRNVEGEAEWMLSGSTNVNYLHAFGVHIWDQWADADGELGPTYGAQLVKQWSDVLREFRLNNASRRAVINLWNVDDIDKMKLPPCYYAMQFYQVAPGTISMKVISRSSDAAIGLPYDFAVCAYLLIKAGIETDLMPHEICFDLTDVHINHENICPIKEYLLSDIKQAPEFRTRFVTTGSATKYLSRHVVELVRYESGDAIKMTVKP